MDIWGVIWLLIALISFPFGYKPIVLLLIVSSLFNASKFLTAGIDFPLFFSIELFTILRLILPYKNEGILKFNDYKSFLVFSLISILWIYSYLATTFFEGFRVYSSIGGSFEYNYAVGGVPLAWSKANINQLMLLSTHLIAALCFYKRKNYFTSIFFINCLFLSGVIFSIFSLLWKINLSLFQSISLIYFNMQDAMVSAFNPGRLAGTFSEPSAAGLYLGTLALPFFLHSQLKYKLMGLIFLYLLYLNQSSTGIFIFILSVFVFVFGYLRARLDKKIILIMLFLLMVFLLLIFNYDFVMNYIFDKGDSESGVLRQASIENSLNNLEKSWFLGLGVGSVRPSSLLVSLLINFGVFTLPFLFYTIFSLIDRKINDRNTLFLRLLLILCFLGGFVSLPEYTNAVLWIFIFMNICSNSIEINMVSKGIKNARKL